MIHLGLTREQFWALTPRELAALWRQHRLKLERQDAQIIALRLVYMNVHRDAQKHPMPFTFEDLAGKQKDPEAGLPTGSAERNLSILRWHTAMWHARKRALGEAQQGDRIEPWQTNRTR